VNSGRPLWPAPYSQDNPDALIAFLTECCWTNNEADRKVDLIPKMQYIEQVARHWHACRTTSRALIIEKSRRMLLSWVLRACELWSLGLKTEKGLIAGLDFSKSEEHVWRIWWLYEQLRYQRPDFNLPRSQPREGNVGAQQLGQVLLPNGSLVEALNQDGLNFQGSGFGWVTMEEFSHYRNCDYMFAQAIRVTQGKADSPGGHVVVVTNSSPNKAWHALKATDPGITQLFTGFQKADCVNGALYLRIHYNADPGKTRTWAEAERRRVPSREWEREMEMREDIYDGEPVFADYSDNWHNPLGDHPFPMYERATYVAGWDCGQTLHPAFCLLRITLDRQVQALLEVLAPGPEPMVKFAPRVLKALTKLLPAHWQEVEHWGDTTVTTQNGANGETAQQAARRHGINIRPGSNEWSGRFGAVTWLLTDRMSEDCARFVLDGARCPVLREGFRGAYRFELPSTAAVGPERIYPESPRKDGYSHVQDALQYAAARVQRKFQLEQSQMPTRRGPLDRVLK
jgi:hypothetical protein